MQELEKRLKRQLLQDGQVQLKHSASWCVPVHTVEVTFQPVKRLKMDVLMKMLLLTFQQTTIENAQQLSELFIVEQLFIEDLLSKLLTMGLIVQNNGMYQLSTKGEQQLAEGIFEEQQPIEKNSVLYSPTHKLFLQRNVDEQEIEELPAMYRYAQEVFPPIDEISTDAMKEAVQNIRTPAEEGEELTIITDILSAMSMQINDILCLEYILYNGETDTFYVRVWNTLLSQWDEHLEKQLTEQELLIWREKYLN